MHLEVSRLVRAPPEKVFSAYTDFEAMPRWSKHLTSARVTGREGDKVQVESEGVSARGAQRTRTGVLRLTPPTKVEAESETRYTRSRRTVVFEATPDGSGTKVTASLDVEVKRWWRIILRPSVRPEVVEASASDDLDSFVRYVEALPQ